MRMKAAHSFRLRVGVIAILALAALPCFAGDVAVLKNGFSIRHERREVVGEVTRLYVNADGSSFVDIPTAEIEHYEAAPDLPKAAFTRNDGAQAAGNPLATSGGRLSATNFAGTANGAAGFPGRPKTDLNQVVTEASGRYQLDPDLVNSVIKAESGFNAHAVSRKGAQGLMQLMPGTASKLGVPNAFDPQANVEGGARYLRELLERYNFDLVKALAAYNAGPQRVEQFRGVPPYHETRAYVARIVKDFNKKKIAEEKAAAAQRPGKKSAKATSAKPPAKTTTAQASH
jgi:transglycosylase-like protein with SLT domain